MSFQLFLHENHTTGLIAVCDVCGKRVNGDEANLLWQRRPGALPGVSAFPFYIAHRVRCTRVLDERHRCHHDWQNLDTGIGCLIHNLKLDLRKVRLSMEVLARIG